MSSTMHSLRVLLRVLRCEGLTAVRDRLADAIEASRAERSAAWRDATLDAAGDAPSPPCTLNVSPVPPFPRRGGAQLQMLHRLREEHHHRSTALLYPMPDSWRLELRHAPLVELWRLPPRRHGDPLLGLSAAVGDALEITRARSVHLENPAGLPLSQVAALTDINAPLIVSVHDFSCFCRRPHLIEGGHNRFCSYCDDDERCRRCLAIHGEARPHDQSAYRGHFRRLLAAALAVVFPSGFHRDIHERLFGEVLGAEKAVVVEPATVSLPLPPHRPRRRPHLALVGGLKAHKGGEVALRVVEILRQRQPRLRITAFGDGDPQLLRRARRSGVRIRGYYRADTLPAELRAAGASAAALPSIWPESYGLVVDECLRAGVPVAAFDLGAVGPRLRRLGTGHLAALDAGEEGLADAIGAAMSATGPSPTAIAEQLPTPASSAAAVRALYERLALS